MIYRINLGENKKVSKGNERIVSTDDLFAIVSKLSDDNPGAMNVCMMICQNANDVDQDASANGLLTLRLFDTEEIYGSRIWMLYKDVCNSNIVNVGAILRAMQLGLVARTDVNHAIDNRGKGINVPDLLSQVMYQLPAFNR